MGKWILLVVVSTFLLLGITATLIAVLGIMGETAAERPDGGNAFPEFVYYSPTSERVYRLAVDNQLLFARVNCYCGCVNLAEDPHRDLLDCFLNDDGTFDPHAVGCNVCGDIATDAVAIEAQGKSADEVSRLIDEKYEDVGPSTSS